MYRLGILCQMHSCKELKFLKLYFYFFISPVPLADCVFRLFIMFFRFLRSQKFSGFSQFFLFRCYYWMIAEHTQLNKSRTLQTHTLCRIHSRWNYLLSWSGLPWTPISAVKGFSPSFSWFILMNALFFSFFDRCDSNQQLIFALKPKLWALSRRPVTSK